MAAFSRIQLAAALLEYDNDVANPAAPYRSAYDSAIFSHLRQRNPSRPQVMSRRSTDYLGVPLPTEGGSLSGRESSMSVGHRKSASSIHALRNPFDGAEEDDEPEKDGLEVDLASWGLDAFMSKDKAAKNSSKQKADTFPNPHPVTSLREGSGSVIGSERRRYVASRSMSMGNFGAGGAFLDAQSSIDRRPRSVGDPLDHDEMQLLQAPFQHRRVSSHAIIESLPSAPPLHSVPFPTSGSRSGSPAPYDNEGLASRPGSRGSSHLLDDRRPPHSRTHSFNSLGSRRLLDEAEENPFTVRSPSPDRASRFDPKPSHVRSMSNATMGTMASGNILDQNNIFAVRPPSPSRSSRFDPKMAAHTRTMSNASLGSRMLLDNDGASLMGGASMMSGRPQRFGDRPYSTIDLLRPKVLVMPSPLQSTLGPKEPEPTNLRDGFHLSADGPPLPPGARSARPISAYDPSPVASHLFTPNPRMSLSLSQLAFRNTLMVGGERDVAYSDIDRTLPRATEEGEQMQILTQEPEIDEVDETPAPPVLPVVSEEPSPPGRPAGKLFGKSLIDDLENRKANMRSKQRVFKGDDRPSMMARNQLRRSSTLIDPESLQRPISQRQDSLGTPAALGRRNSANTQPLLNFDDNELTNRATLAANPRLRNGRSVFGTDTLWEREMTKLKEIEAQEKLEKAETEKREVEETARAERKKKKGKKGKGKAKAVEEDSKGLEVLSELAPRVSAEPPVLPAIEKATVRGPPPPVNDDDTESESGDSAPHAPARRKARRDSAETAADLWVAGSSGEDEGEPRRTTGIGRRYRNQGRGKSQPADDDSEEDMPLAATVGRALQRAMSSANDDSDEDLPLSAMLDKAKTSVPPINFDSLSVNHPRNDDDDDDQPLGLRASMIPPTSHSFAGNADDDDDKPLAFHPDQQRRTQYQAMAQQQQMMMQAQMQQSMFFGAPSMMGSGFFGPPMAPTPSPMMMGLQQPMPSPLPAPDAGKFGLVDRWRRDVAVEGQP